MLPPQPVPSPVRTPRGRRGRLLASPAVAALLVLVAGCAKKGADPFGPTPPPDPTATFTRVQREVFNPSCALSGCHAAVTPSAGMILEAGRSWASLVGAVSAETSLLRVEPFQPESSYLVVKVRGDAAILGARMPSGAPPLSADQVKLIVDWVKRGAPND